MSQSERSAKHLHAGVDRLIERHGTMIFKRGSFISADRIEKAVSIKKTEDKYKFAILSLSMAVEKEMRRKTGRYVMTRIENQGIRILTTSQAAKYGMKRLKELSDRLERWEKRMEDI